SGWGEWPGGEPEPAEEAGAESLAAPLGEPGPAPTAGESDEEPAAAEPDLPRDRETAPVHTDEPEPFAGRPTVEAPLEDAELGAPEPPAVQQDALDSEDGAPEVASEQDEQRPPAESWAAQDAPEPAPTPEREWPGVPARSAQREEFDAYGVPTETLAALYEAQGFADRAAAVYRALLRDR